MPATRRRFAALASALALLVAARPARAVLDVENKGPTLSAGAFAMRITNIGSIGNPFFDVGRSFDPSFEYPRGSGNEGLKHADLWVGAKLPSLGQYRVSGGPLLEWRPTLDPKDHVYTAVGGQLGSQPYVDDDGDGRIDEEQLNGLDDDGDGEIDEDLGVTAAQELYAQYVDDRPEAVAYGYSGGEAHVPLHLDVKQRAFTWSIPGYDRIAGIHFEVTNHGSETLEDVRLGLLADLDSRAPGESGGSTNDLLKMESYAMPFNDGVSSITSVDIAPYGTDYKVPYTKSCSGVLSGQWPVVYDAAAGSKLPAFGVMGLSHSTDIFAIMKQAKVVDNRVDPYITAPASVNFKTTIFAMDLPSGQGGAPIFDADRYAALAGNYPGVAVSNAPHDYAALITCGPFGPMAPGRTYTFDVALVCGPTPDSVATTMGLAALTYRGRWINIKPDTLTALMFNEQAGKSGYAGHETCLEAPPTLDFIIDPHCHQKFIIPKENGPPNYDTHVPHGTCLWVDADCDACTGFNGNETHATWADPAGVPPSPAYRAVPGDQRIDVQWDNSPEVLLGAATSGATLAPTTFKGYNVYRLSDWHRKSLLPGPFQFQLLASFGLDTLQGERPLAGITDSTLDYDRIRFGRKQYDIGRYHFADSLVRNGFDYLYVVTTVGERTTKITPTFSITERFESPIVSSLDSTVTPHESSLAAGGKVWVVPNPFRQSSPWDRQQVAGDPFGRHLDFMGLPAAKSVIKIYTLAGDLVQRLDHDGSDGNGETRWNLISRNGQDIESGIYLFTVDSRLGHEVGRFVVIR